MTRTQATAIQLLSRFRLADLAILVALVIFLCSPRPDTQARADISTNRQKIEDHGRLIEKLDRNKEEKETSDIKYQELIKRLDHMQKSIDDLTERELSKR